MFTIVYLKQTMFLGYVWLPWLRFSLAFSSVVRQMPGWNPQRRGIAHTLPNFCVVPMYFFMLFYVFLCCSIYYLFCVVLCIVCVYMCTVLLPPGGYPIAVKCIISYHIISYHIISYHIISYHIQCCSYSLITIYATCNVISHVQCFVLYYWYSPKNVCSAQYCCFL